MDEAALGKRLQLARKRAGLTQQALCQKAGLSYSTLAKIERGAIKAPSIFTVASIAKATATSLENLLGIENGSLGSADQQNNKKRSKTGISFVYFDIDGVLITTYAHTFPALSRKYDVPVEIIENAFWRHNDAVCRGDTSLEEFNQAVGKEANIADFDFLSSYFDTIKPVAEAIELLNWTAQHYDIGLISNHMPTVTNTMFERGLIPKLDYKSIVDSCKVGVIKPEPMIYQKAEELAAVEPREILLVDDTRPNLTAADRAGWQICWFDTFEPEASAARVKKLLEF